MLPSSNQQVGYSSDLNVDTPFAVKKPVIDTNDAVTTATSPEIENLSDNPDDSDHEIAHETQRHTEDESHEMLAQRCRQLQEDVEVLASHLENQQRDYERERKQAEDQCFALLQKNAALERELSGLRVERDALFKQSTRMTSQHADHEQHANDARETQEELLRALSKQQKQAELLQAAVACAEGDRAAARKALDKAQMHCRRLEEELSSAHAQMLHLQNERDTMQAALDATVSGAAGFEARHLEAQDEVIASLRADLVQMEFELKTLSVDKATLEDQVEKLELRLTTTERNDDYEVVPLDNNSTSDAIAKRTGQKKRTTIRPVRSRRENRSRRGSDLFNNLMELPNAVGQQPSESANATIWLSPAASYFSSPSNANQNDHDHGQSRSSFRDKITPPAGLTSFVAKTVQSARKHFRQEKRTSSPDRRKFN